MALPRDLSLSPQELDALMTSQWVMRIATIGPGTRINLTPMWFGWAGGRVYVFSRGQKVVNLRREPACTIVVDKNERFPELVGAMFQGTAAVLEDAAAEAADPFLAEARAQMGRKYAGGHGETGAGEPNAKAAPFAATAGGKNRRWVVLSPARLVTWDNHKLRR